MLPDVPIVQVFRGILPYLAADVVRLMLVLLIPAIVLWLPSMMSH
jgi:TRAP-type C4-dicarboxylate transport system permease large subunit